MMACDSEIEGGRATTYTYVSARAGAGSYSGCRNTAPRCLLPCPLRSRRGYIFSSFPSEKTLRMTSGEPRAGASSLVGRRDLWDSGAAAAGFWSDFRFDIFHNIRSITNSHIDEVAHARSAIFSHQTHNS